ncbi:hypothetical protein [Xanthomonas phage NEB7]|nr:hypothetical protein [Xanthomonas phage NEB7]
MAAPETTCDPSDYFTKPIEAWTLRELTDAIGMHANTARLLGISEEQVRTMRYRRVTSRERMQVLQDEVRRDEAKYRGQLVTEYTTRSLRRPRRKPTTTE